MKLESTCARPVTNPICNGARKSPASFQLKTIVIAGSCSRVGKTTLAAELLRHLKGYSALKTTVVHEGSCARQGPCGICHTQDKPFTLIKDDDTIEQPGKDTQRLKEAGADEVYWLIAKENSLKEGLEYALKEFGDCEGVVIEGTSVLKYFDPDLAIFIKGPSTKPSAVEVLEKADICVAI